MKGITNRQKAVHFLKLFVQNYCIELGYFQWTNIGNLITFMQIIPMVSEISEGIGVSIETFYQPDYSNPLQSEYMFAYRITIENCAPGVIASCAEIVHANN